MGEPEEMGRLGEDQVAAKMGKDFAIVIKKDAGVRSASIDRGPIKVTLPNSTKTMVQFGVGMKISDVIKKVCDKRNLSAADFHIQTSDGIPLPSDLSIQEVSGDDLMLCPNVAEVDEPTLAGIASDHDAFKWKVFNVTYAKRKNFSLGISDEHIKIFKKKRDKDKKAVQPDVRQFSDLKEITEGKGSKAFTITWTDGKQELFESSHRKEIVAKVVYILKKKK